jgi:hypothetical protein
MNKAISILLAAVAVIHLLPLSGVLGPERLAVLYGLPFDEPSLQIMMRHRAVLFGMLGVFLLGAAFKPEWQPVAFAAGFVSTVSFLWLAWSVGGYNAAIGRVVVADVVAVACLAVAVVLHLLRQRAVIA